MPRCRPRSTRFGRLDVMFNNAGIASPRRGILLEEHTDADFDRLVDVNARGVFNGCRAAVRQFKEQGGGGVVVNTGSVAGMVSWGSAVYGGTKAMVIQMTRALAIEGAPFGIRANCICPGGMFTNFGVAEGEAFFRERSPEELEMAKTLHPARPAHHARGLRRSGALPRVRPRRPTSPGWRFRSTAGTSRDDRARSCVVAVERRLVVKLVPAV